MSVWNPENVRDVAESVGMMALSDDVAQNLARDVEFRLSQVLEEALKAMRHGKKTTLSTQDVSQALRALDAEPLYGYESTRPLRFGEATLGPGQPLFYVEDDEMDLEKLINAPLPKVPRDMSFTGKRGGASKRVAHTGEAAKAEVIRHSALARRRGRATDDTAEPYHGRNTKSRPACERRGSQHPCGRPVHGRGRCGEAAGQACLVQGTAALL